MTTRETLQPKPTLLCKLGSIAVHADEFFGPGGYGVDAVALQALLRDHEVQRWIRSMGLMLPKKRAAR